MRARLRLVFLSITAVGTPDQFLPLPLPLPSESLLSSPVIAPSDDCLLVQSAIAQVIRENAQFEESVVWVGGRHGSGTLGRRGYRAKPRDGHHAHAAGRRPRCTRRALRIQTRLRRLEQR